MFDANKGIEIRLFIHLFQIGADSQMRYALGSVNPPSLGSALAFGVHEIREENLALCLQCKALKPTFYQCSGEDELRDITKTTELLKELRVKVQDRSMTKEV